MASHILYVVQLKDDTPKFFVYYTETEDVNKVMMECEILFEFPYLFKPQSIAEQSWTADVMNVDKYVKKYMFQYGIENVRGGSYQSTVLSDEQIRHIQTEFNYLEQIQHEKNMRHFLYSNLYSANKEQINEITNFNISLNETIEKKRKQLEQLETFKNKKDEPCAIQPILNDIEVLLNEITEETECVKEVTPATKNLYKSILPGLKYILRMAPTIDSSLQYDHKYLDMERYFTNPEFLLDNIIFHSKSHPTMSAEKQKLLQVWCHVVYGVIYWFKNRIDELRYDLGFYPDDVEWKLHTICRRLDYTPPNENGW